MHWWEFGVLSTDWGLVLGWINWGLVVNTLAAAGSVSAAVVALHIATQDRRERQRESKAAAMAQARLVMVGLYASMHPNESWPQIALTCTNHGDHPILDVEPVRAWVSGFPQFDGVVGAGKASALLRPGDVREFVFNLSNDEGVLGPPIPVEAAVVVQLLSLPLIGAVAFTDAAGNRWRKFSDGTIERIDQKQ
ncbi:hypothetical protein [Mycobacteroides abscessus]|uniref:hypothetical protein n=1 Tax=Mycobacteroides abscessus TaxID=36809 RepID=UPI000D3E4177|nr:hypothetical protein [Mycobacteroides abscessus]PVA20840.1 hypothetical protein DDJ52_16650 [Mycobacteroides abscessus]